MIFPRKTNIFNLKFRPVLAGAMAGFLVFAPNAAAFELENLIVTSNQEAGFHAQLPFKHFAPLDVHDLHVQIIPLQTGEHPWSSPNSLLQGLQFRLVQSSKSSGFIELLAENPNKSTNNHFDLRLLISYQDNSWTHHYKVFPTEIPVSINAQHPVQTGQSFSTHLQRPAYYPPRTSPSTRMDASLRVPKPGHTTQTSLSSEASNRPQIPSPQKLTQAAYNESRPAFSDLGQTAPQSPDSKQTPNNATTANYVVVTVLGLSLLLIGFWAGRQRPFSRSAITKRQPRKSVVSNTNNFNPRTSYAPAPQQNFDTQAQTKVQTPSRPIHSVDADHAATQFAPSHAGTNLIEFPTSSKTPAVKTAFEAQIDLAKIYVGMRDLATARLILEEVVESGNDSERDQALKILKTL
jgi:FimV-like protein